MAVAPVDIVRQIRNRRTTPAVHDPEGSSVTTTENPSGSWQWRWWELASAMILAGGEDAGHWRAEGEGLGVQMREAGSPQQVLDFAGGAAGVVCYGPRA